MPDDAKQVKQTSEQEIPFPRLKISLSFGPRGAVPVTEGKEENYITMKTTKFLFHLHEFIYSSSGAKACASTYQYQYYVHELLVCVRTCMHLLQRQI